MLGCPQIIKMENTTGSTIKIEIQNGKISQKINLIK